MKIIPSIISGNLLAIGEDIERTKQIGAMHIDIEDGNFSTGITVGLDMVEAISKVTQAQMDVHLVVTNPADYIEPLYQLGVSGIAVHVEGVIFPSKLLGMIKNRGMRVGLAITLKTPAEDILPFADMIDYVLILTNEQDCRELLFRTVSYEKIRRARALLSPEIEIWADGGIKESNLKKVAESGADHAIVGRAIMLAEDPYKECLRLEALTKGEA